MQFKNTGCHQLISGESSAIRVLSDANWNENTTSGIITVHNMTHLPGTIWGCQVIIVVIKILDAQYEPSRSHVIEIDQALD